MPMLSRGKRGSPAGVVFFANLLLHSPLGRGKILKVTRTSDLEKWSETNE